MPRTIIAVFEGRDTARTAASELADAGFAPGTVRPAEPMETVQGDMLVITSDDGPLDRVMEILNRHRPLDLEQHEQGSFDAGEFAQHPHEPGFDLKQSIDESLGREDWATAEGKCTDPDRQEECAAKQVDDAHEAF